MEKKKNRYCVAPKREAIASIGEPARAGADANVSKGKKIHKNAQISAAD